MRHTHFSSLKPVCPLCRRNGETIEIAISVIEDERDGDILSGILLCARCGAEFPVIDGLPILLTDVRRYIQDNIFYLLARDDLPPKLQSLVGDAAGPGGGFDSLRQHVSTYMWDHWGDRDPEGTGRVPAQARPGSIARNLHRLLAMDGALPQGDGPILDIGCGAGRTVMELAEATGRQVLGIDISVSLARAGRKAVTGNTIDYYLRRAGLAYERRNFPIASGRSDLADIWICDVLALPFADQSFGMASAMNVLDCVRDPRAALIEISRVLGPGGSALMSVPFDWSGQVTPPEAWLGGHSQRAPHGGEPEAILDMLLSEGPLAAGRLRRHGLTQEADWHVRLHDRSLMQYTALLAVAHNI